MIPKREQSMKNIPMLMAGILMLLGFYDLHAETINEVLPSCQQRVC